MHRMNVEINEVRLQDIEQLREIATQTFVETFAAENSKEDMTRYVEDGFSTKQLKSELRNANTQFYFARLGDRCIGYLKINTGAAQTEMQGDKALEIERIYVLQEFHGQGVGQLLYRKALDIASAKTMDYVWLGVWEKNPRAIRFYEKNGFIPFDKHIFRLGDDEQTDVMMKLPLK